MEDSTIGAGDSTVRAGDSLEASQPTVVEQMQYYKGKAEGLQYGIERADQLIDKNAQRVDRLIDENTESRKDYIEKDKRVHQKEMELARMADNKDKRVHKKEMEKEKGSGKREELKLQLELKKTELELERVRNRVAGGFDISAPQTVQALQPGGPGSSRQGNHSVSAHAEQLQKFAGLVPLTK